MSRRIVVSLLKPPRRSILSSNALHEIPLQRPALFRRSLPSRHLSSTSVAARPIVLEKPEQFRPPSHPSRLNARRIPRHYPGPPVPEAEKAAQATRKYPHTFPNEGTRMHWFLTNKYVHLWISLGTLFALSFITLTRSFLHTSPFAHLTPPISALLTGPLPFIRDWISVIRMHQQYTTEQAAESRAKGIADAQKRRLYRRAHGMEDVDKEGVGQGIDVRGLVSWDDGMTRGERERERMRREAAGIAGDAEAEAGDVSLASKAGELGQEKEVVEEPRRERRPLRKWLGIW